MRQVGQTIGRSVVGGEVIELIGDVGAGKTTLTKGIAEGMGIGEPVQSPTFTISRIYLGSNGSSLAHYDFYRLSEAGIMSEEIVEMSNRPDMVTVVEWAGAIKSVLPDDRLQVTITVPSENGRLIILASSGEHSRRLQKKLEKALR